MSTPASLAVPEGVEVATIETGRGSFAAHLIRPPEATAHVLLLPGWTGSKEDFTHLLPHLASAGFAATSVDQRGQHETPGTADDDYSLSGLAADAAEIAATVWDGPSHLLGHSFGGLVTQSAAIEHSAAWRSIALLCSGPGALGGLSTVGLTRLVDLIDQMSLKDLHRHREALAGTRTTPEIVAFLERRFTSNAPASFRAMTQHLIDAPTRVWEVARTGLPAWVGRGVADDAWPHAVQADMATQLGTEVVVLPRSAHSPNVENPAALAASLTAFYRDL